jgi:hypothetical protein
VILSTEGEFQNAEEVKIDIGNVACSSLGAAESVEI